MSELTITLIQTSLHWENPDANRKMFEEKINSIRERTELVILPEMFNTGFSMHPEQLAEPMDGPTVRWMKEISRKKNVILTGSIAISEGGNYYNRLLWVLPNGDIGCYDKRHLFAFSEEHHHYQAGNKKLIARVKGWKVCPVVCYDLRFPVWLRQDTDAARHYDLLICVANWPHSRVAAWDTLLKARAIENQCYVAGVNTVGADGNGIDYSGHSIVIDPVGAALTAETNAETIITCLLKKETVNETRSRFPFLDDADHFTL